MVKKTNTIRLKQKTPNLLLNQFYLFLIFLLVFSMHPALIGDLQSAENSQRKPRVLVIHSYHHGFTWSDNISNGIRSVLEKHSDRIELLFEFMDTRRIYSDEYFKELKRFYKTKYAGRKIDVIICSDDHSFNFMTGLGQEVFPNTPIVFCSVSGYEPEIRIGRQITGLLESIDIRATLDIALKLHPKTKEVAVISDMTRTGRALKSKAEKIFNEYRPRIQFRYLEDLTVEELQ